MDKIIQEAKNGDPIAIEQLVADYKGLVRSLANRFYLVGGDKDDLLQEGMLGLIHAINSYDETKGSFPSFVGLCVLRQILDAVKRDSAAKQKPLYNYVNLDVTKDWSDGSNPLDRLLQKEYAEKVARVLAEKLSPLERVVVTLFSEGYTYDDIMTRTGRSYKAVDGALQRARKKLTEFI
ncbi:MAG: sigma-70 family RNA polymerase sigma factor [Clostridiales bacterium]|nr:sigma-70 family RNA polymerase sigma factor [Clostridiales bacterium]